jgi:hypothetical protein
MKGGKTSSLSLGLLREKGVIFWTESCIIGSSKLVGDSGRPEEEIKEGRQSLAKQ